MERTDRRARPDPHGRSGATEPILGTATAAARQLAAIPDVADLTLFAGCSRTSLRRVRSLLTPVLLAADQVMIEHGASPRQFAVIADGEVSVVDRSGREVAVLGPGSIVGELGLLRERPADATVRTLTPVVAYVGNRWEFLAMLDASRDVERRVLRTALARAA